MRFGLVVLRSRKTFMGNGARPVHEFRMSGADRADDEVFCLLAWAGIGPGPSATARGRKTGRARTNPVILVKQGKQQWLVAPYGTVSWVLNAQRRRAGHPAPRA